MLTLRQSLPASFATKPDATCVPFSRNDTPEALKENVCATVGLHPALKPAVRITNTNPLVPLGSIEGLPDLADTDSVIKSLEIMLMETGWWACHRCAPATAATLSISWYASLACSAK